MPDPIVRRRAVSVFKNRFGELFNDDVTAPSGAQGAFLRWHGAQGVIAVPVLTAPDGTDSFLMIPHYRYAPDDVFLELPRGGMDEGENPVDAARRECLEETGFTGEHAVVLGQVFADTGLIELPVNVVLVRVTDPNPVPVSHEPFESLDPPRWVSADEVDKLMSAGGIRCALTLAAIALAWPHLVSNFHS